MKISETEAEFIQKRKDWNSIQKYIFINYKEGGWKWLLLSLLCPIAWLWHGAHLGIMICNEVFLGYDCYSRKYKK